MIAANPMDKVLSGSSLYSAYVSLTLWLDKSFAHSIPARGISWLLQKVKASAIGRWFMRPDEELEVFSTSVAFDRSERVLSSSIDRLDKAAEASHSLSTLQGLYRKALEDPLKVLGLIGLVAVLTNTSITLSFGEAGSYGIVIRLILIVMFLLLMQADKKSIDYGRCISWLRER